MSANGKLKPSELAPIPGGQLAKPAARAWNAFSRYCKATHGITISVNDSYRPLGAPGDLARGRWSQWAAWEKYQSGGNLAAYPGTSNHGLGMAIDCGNSTQSAINSWGANFGWSKQWSDAKSEPWHYLFSAAHATNVVAKWSQVLVNDQIKLGDVGPGVKALKDLMRAKHFFPYPSSTYMGAPSVWWLKRFQKSRRLSADGVAGPATWAALRAKK